MQRTPRAAEAEALISIRRVAKSYTRGEQGVPVLTDINLDIGRGDSIPLFVEHLTHDRLPILR